MGFRGIAFGGGGRMSKMEITLTGATNTVLGRTDISLILSRGDNCQRVKFSVTETMDDELNIKPLGNYTLTELESNQISVFIYEFYYSNYWDT